MNINITSGYDATDTVRLISDKAKNREVELANTSVSNELSRLEKEKIQQAVTMDVSELRDFLFMLINSKIKVKSEIDNQGALINRLV